MVPGRRIDDMKLLRTLALVGSYRPGPKDSYVVRTASAMRLHAIELTYGVLGDLGR